MPDTTALVFDGCSGGVSKTWRLAFRRSPPFEGCCDSHDRAYRTGSSRAEADAALFVCVVKNGHPWFALIFWIAVRIFGGPYWHRKRQTDARAALSGQ